MGIRMIYDCILYNNEKDLLNIRLHETCLCNDEVTTIVVQATTTHTGFEKPLYFSQKGLEQFNIVCCDVDLPKIGTPKQREIFQRNEIKQFLLLIEPKDDDIIIISDVDEIPRARQIKLFKPDIDFAALIQDKYAYFLNWIESEQSWDRARIMSWRYLKDKQPNEVRDSGYDFSLHHSGWHYSWVVDPIKKLESFSHTELNTIQNLERISNKENIWNDDKFKKIAINLSHPEYLYRNQDKFKHLIDEIF